MITYEIICFCCKSPFFVEEGSQKYQVIALADVTDF